VRGLYREKLVDGLASRTVHYIHVTLHKALKDAVADGLISRNVTDAVRAPRAKGKEINALTPDLARAFLEAAGEVEDRFEAPKNGSVQLHAHIVRRDLPANLILFSARPAGFQPATGGLEVLGATLRGVSPRTEIRPSNAANHSFGKQRRSIAYRSVSSRLQYGCSKWQCGTLEGEGEPDNIVDGAHAPWMIREASTVWKVYWRSSQQTLGMIWNRLRGSANRRVAYVSSNDGKAVELL
jgi:hypothetical protein